MTDPRSDREIALAAAALLKERGLARDAFERNGKLSIMGAIIETIDGTPLPSLVAYVVNAACSARVYNIEGKLTNMLLRSVEEFNDDRSACPNTEAAIAVLTRFAAQSE